jgi:hypothetical protein
MPSAGSATAGTNLLKQATSNVRAQPFRDPLYELSQDFIGLFKEHKAQALQDWLSSELKSIAKSMQQDYSAIEAACSQSWNHDHVA